MKLYKAKTGNDWTQLPSFRRCTKKSALVPFDLMNRIPAADLEFDLEAEVESKLSPELQDLLHECTSVVHLKEVVKKSNLGPFPEYFRYFLMVISRRQILLSPLLAQNVILAFLRI